MKTFIKRHFKQYNVYLQLVFLLCFYSCKTVAQEVKNGSMTFETILQNEYGGYAMPTILVVKEETLLQEFFSQINKTRKPGLPIPKVDFNEQMLIVICAGERKSSGNEIYIKSVIENNEQITIHLEEKKPSENELNAMVITSPFTIVKIERKDKKLVFVN